MVASAARSMRTEKSSASRFPMGSAAQYFEVQTPVAQVYAYWRDFSNFPKSVEWDAEIVEDPDKQVQRAIDGFRQVVESGRLGG